MTFDDKTIDDVWDKARETSGKDPDNIRHDACGAAIKKDDYGNRKSDQGWEIDHKDPNGGDDLSNLQALQWKNNVDKSDGKLQCSCNKED